MQNEKHGFTCFHCFLYLTKKKNSKKGGKKNLIKGIKARI